jgi:hypothetical protein
MRKPLFSWPLLPCLITRQSARLKKITNEYNTELLGTDTIDSQATVLMAAATAACPLITRHSAWLDISDVRVTAKVVEAEIQLPRRMRTVHKHKIDSCVASERGNLAHLNEIKKNKTKENLKK